MQTMKSLTLIVLALLCISQVKSSDLPCEVEEYDITGFADNTGVVLYASDQITEAKDCFELCCGWQDGQCKAAWMYKDTYGRDICQLRDSAENRKIYSEGTLSKVGVIINKMEENKLVTSDQGPLLPGQSETQPEQPNPSVVQQSQTIPEGSIVLPDGRVVLADGTIQSNTAVEQPQAIPQVPSQVVPSQDIPSQVVSSQDIPSQAVQSPQEAAPVQGQWVYDPSNGQYVYVNGGNVEAQQNTVIETGIDTETKTDNSTDGPTTTDNTTATTENPLMTSTDPGWFNWWPFGANKASDDEDYEEEEEEWEKWGEEEGAGDDEDEDAYEEEEEEWENEWKEEEEEEEKEWEEEMEELEAKMEQTTFTTPEESTTGGGVTDEADEEIVDEWLKEQIGDFDSSKPETVIIAQQPASDSKWGSFSRANASVIAVGACAAVVLVLLLLILVGKKMTGKNDRAQYKPLRESFTGSSTYHEDI